MAAKQLLLYSTVPYVGQRIRLIRLEAAGVQAACEMIYSLEHSQPTLISVSEVSVYEASVQDSADDNSTA